MLRKGGDGRGRAGTAEPICVMRRNEGGVLVVGELNGKHRRRETGVEEGQDVRLESRDEADASSRGRG